MTDSNADNQKDSTPTLIFEYGAGKEARRLMKSENSNIEELEQYITYRRALRDYENEIRGEEYRQQEMLEEMTEEEFNQYHKEQWEKEFFELMKRRPR